MTRGQPELVFGALTLNNASCFQSAGITLNGNPIKYQCGGSLKSTPGVPSYQIAFSIVVSASDYLAKATALRENAQDTVDFYPYGNSSGNPKRSSTVGTVVSVNAPASPTALTTFDVVIDLDDLADSAVA